MESNIDEVTFNFDADIFSEKELNEKRLNLIDINKEAKVKCSIDKKKMKRVQTKQKRKEKRKIIAEENKQMVAQMTKEERLIYYANKKKDEKEKEENLLKGLSSEYIIAFDMDYLSFMKTKEVKSLATQLSYAYSLNKILKYPIQYYYCNYNGEIKDEMEAMGSQNWHARRFSQPLEEVDEIFKSGKEIVYLSPDSENILTEINKNTIYIIGGFVDKPVKKNRSLYKAKELNIKTAKLPLENYIDDIVNQVLNVNTVVEIIGYFLESNDIGEAIRRAIPQRMKDNNK